MAEMVYEREPNCLSYEVSLDQNDPCKAIIVERYQSRGDAEGLHQETLKIFRGLSVSNILVDNKLMLSRYEESNYGFMDPR